MSCSFFAFCEKLLMKKNRKKKNHFCCNCNFLHLPQMLCSLYVYILLMFSTATFSCDRGDDKNCEMSSNCYFDQQFVLYRRVLTGQNSHQTLILDRRSWDVSEKETKDKMACKLTFLAFCGIFCVKKKVADVKKRKKSEFWVFCLFWALSFIRFRYFHCLSHFTGRLFGLWFRVHYFFRDRFGYVSESEVARILDEW